MTSRHRVSAHAEGKVRVLPAEVSLLIAAGEVIERPASVARELIDNSLDAGSSCIEVEVTDGGLGMIRVTDDGEGMSAQDAVRAFERHATSKLRREEDLSAIRTLGFRGEALPSIASVSHLRVSTATRAAAVGTQLSLKAGTVTETSDVATVPGTRIEVLDLFFNTPARKKFLKSPVTEFSHICQAAQHAALVFPQVQFRLVHNGREVFAYPSVASRRDRVRQVYGSRFAEEAIAITEHRTGLVLEGFIVDPASARASRTPQDLFVNRRVIKNAAVVRALYDGYGASFAKGAHPTFVLFLDVEPSRVDVNVHPAKREVRFADHEMVYHTVRGAVRNGLAPVGSECDSSSGGQAVHAVTPVTSSDPMLGEMTGTRSSAVAQQSQSHSLPWSEGEHVREPRQTYAALPGLEVHPLGQVNETFLVAKVGTELHVVDQHTAHERVLFERLSRRWRERQVVSQPLLIPEQVELAPHQAVLLDRHLADLEPLGLAIERFGGASFLIRAAPSDLRGAAYRALLDDIVDDLSQWNRLASLEARIQPILASLACHAAVRAGRSMDLPEIKQLIEDWAHAGYPTTCPHGRRIALRLSIEELSRIFGRA